MGRRLHYARRRKIQEGAGNPSRKNKHGLHKGEEMKAHKKAGKVEAARKGTVGFEVNPYYEGLLEMREKKPAAYKIMSAATRLAVEAYVKAKDAASVDVAAKAAA